MNLRAKLESTIEAFQPTVRVRSEKDLQLLWNENISSFDDLVGVVRNSSSDIEVRRVACWALGRLQEEGAAEALLVAFKDEDAALSWEAAKSIGLLQAKRCVLPMVALLEDRESRGNRRAAAYALGHIGDGRATEPLIGVLTNTSEKPELRGEAAEALAMLGSSRAIGPLIAALADREVEVRFWATYALGVLGDPCVVPHLQRLAHGDHEELPNWGKISTEAMDAIANINARYEDDPDTGHSN